jgi:hypothetical protein
VERAGASGVAAAIAEEGVERATVDGVVHCAAPQTVIPDEAKRKSGIQFACRTRAKEIGSLPAQGRHAKSEVLLLVR